MSQAWLDDELKRVETWLVASQGNEQRDKNADANEFAYAWFPTPPRVDRGVPTTLRPGLHILTEAQWCAPRNAIFRRDGRGPRHIAAGVLFLRRNPEGWEALGRRNSRSSAWVLPCSELRLINKLNTPSGPNAVAYVTWDVLIRHAFMSTTERLRMQYPFERLEGAMDSHDVYPKLLECRSEGHEDKVTYVFWYIRRIHSEQATSGVLEPYGYRAPRGYWIPENLLSVRDRLIVHFAKSYQ